MFREQDIRRAVNERQYADASIYIPEELIIRSLPVNLELLELIRD